jgi:uncharacterized membrane protein YhaH (DUF805 family)
MGFGDAVKTCFSKYVEFSGRASRPEYWWFFLSYILVYIVTLIIGGAIEVPALVVIAALAYFLPLLSAAVRRLHDTGRSGWWYLIGLVPFVGFIILIVFLAGEGNPGQNEYGPPPSGAAMGGATPPPPPPPSPA